MKQDKQHKENKNKSGPAVFMDTVIILMAVCAAVCFALYYSGLVRHGTLLWIGISAFTVVYHFKGRLIMGEQTKKWKISYTHPFFRERSFEQGLYRLLRVRDWRGKVLTYDPAAFDLGTHTLPEIADTMSKAEVDHWINELISLSTLLFGLVWGETWIFALTAVMAMLFDSQFILVQRYNRRRVVALINKGKLRL